MNTIDMRQYMGDDFARNVMISEYLSKFWEETPIDPQNDWDLNPSHYIKQIAENIARQVASAGVTCTTEDVLLHWVTMAVNYKLFLPNG